MSETNYCPSCGTPLEAGAGFCGGCGEKVEITTAPPTGADGTRRRWPWLAAAGILLIAVVVSVLMLTGPDGGARSVEADLEPSEGGVVELAGLARLEVPPGALSEAATVSIVAEDEPPAGAPPEAEVVGEAFRVEVGGAELLAPVFLELPYDEEAVGEESIVFAGFYDEEEGRWFSRFGEVEEESDRVIIETTHLSRWSTFTRTLRSVVDSTADRAASTLGFLKSPFEFLGVPAADMPRCPEPVGRMMIPSYLNPEVQDLVLACVEGGEEEHEAVVRLVNNRAFPLIVELPSGVEVDVQHTEERELFNAVTIGLRETLGIDAVFLPAAAETTIHLSFPEPGEATFVATSSRRALAIDLLFTILLELGSGGSGGGELVSATNCLLTAVESDTEGGDLGELTQVVSDCASNVVPGLGQVRDVFRGTAGLGQSILVGFDSPRAEVTVRYVGPSTEPEDGAREEEPDTGPEVEDPVDEPADTVEDLAWSQVPYNDAIFSDAQMSSVTAGGPGLVAVGRESGQGSWAAAAWTSTDGLSWSRVPHDEDVFGRARMSSVTAGGPGLVAVGEDSAWGNAAVWTSTDGLSWSRVPHDEDVFSEAQMLSVAVGGPGLVAVGYEEADFFGDDSTDAAAVWTSTDGLSWSRVPHDEDVFSDARMSSVAAGGPGLVAVGGADLDPAGDWDGDDAAVWTSTDGLSWSRVPSPNVLFSEAWMSSVTAGGPGLVAVGHDFSDDHGADAAVWTSTDGLDWSRVPHDEDVFSEAQMLSVTVGGPGLVAVGEDGSTGDADVNDAAAVWISTDGLSWSQVPYDDAAFGSSSYQQMHSVTAGSRGLVAVGRSYQGVNHADAAVWVAAPVDPLEDPGAPPQGDLGTQAVDFFIASESLCLTHVDQTDNPPPDPERYHGVEVMETLNSEQVLIRDGLDFELIVDFGSDPVTIYSSQGSDAVLPHDLSFGCPPDLYPGSADH